MASVIHFYHQQRQAIRNLDVEHMRRLLDEGMDVNLIANKETQDTLLTSAARSGVVEICKLLLDRGANANACQRCGVTALDFAARDNNVELAELLVRSGAGLAVPRDGGITPLHETARHGSVEVARFLIDGGATVHARDGNGATPLHWCVRSGKLGVCQLLLEAGADPNALNDRGATPLHFSVGVDSQATEEGCLLLIQHGASSSYVPNDPPTGYLTPFQSAVKDGAESIVKFFFDQCHEDPSQTTLAGWTMLQMAGGGNPRMQKLLMALATEHAVRSNIKPGDENDVRAPTRSLGRTPPL